VAVSIWRRASRTGPEVPAWAPPAQNETKLESVEAR